MLRFRALEIISNSEVGVAGCDVEVRSRESCAPHSAGVHVIEVSWYLLSRRLHAFKRSTSCQTSNDLRVPEVLSFGGSVMVRLMCHWRPKIAGYIT
jgi:hypothetical protein